MLEKDKICSNCRCICKLADNIGCDSWIKSDDDLATHLKKRNYGGQSVCQ